MAKAKRKTTPRARAAHPKPEHRHPDILEHFKAKKPASQIKLSAFHDGTGWCIKATADGFKPFLFGGYAVDERTAEWAAGKVATAIGATLVKGGKETAETEEPNPYCEPSFRTVADMENPLLVTGAW